MPVHLRPRLAAVEQMLSMLNVSCVADVGCDHGKLTASLLQNGIAKHVYASDISAKSIAKAETLIEKCALLDQVTFDCSCGLSHLAAEQIDAVVIAGMGGELIARLIDESYETARSCAIVMQPMRGTEELRQYLFSNGFAIFDEKIMYDAGRYYQIIAARAGKMEFPLGFRTDCYKYGVVSFIKHDPLLPDLLANDLKGLRKQVEQALDKKVTLSKLSTEIANIEALLRECEEW